MGDKLNKSEREVPMTESWTILLSFLTILAILSAPLVAIQVSRYLDEKKEAKKRKLDIFRTLMATRAAVLTPEHVHALNAIDIEFYGNNDVIQKWRIYNDHLHSVLLEQEKPKNEDEWKRWTEKSQNLFVDLLETMALNLKYQFPRVDITRGHYRPQAYGDIENDQFIIRKGLVSIFQGKKWFPMMTWLIPPPPLPDQKSSEQVGVIAEKSFEKIEVKK